MRIKRIVFVNRAPFENLDLDLEDKHIISLTGINGSGKTTIISYVVDAFYEIARKVFNNEFSGEKEGKLYRVSSKLYNVWGANKSMVYILFESLGKEIHYFDLYGTIDKDSFDEMMSIIWNNIKIEDRPIRFRDVASQFRNGSMFAKYISIDVDEASKTFSNNVLTYFPSYRYEQPGYLNDVFRMELSYSLFGVFKGYLVNPIEVTSDLPYIANWIMDVVFDGNQYSDSSTEVVESINMLIDKVFYNKMKKRARIGIGTRKMGGARIQIVDSESGKLIYPSIFNISAGESALLCIFGEIMRQADNLNRRINDVEGIVIIDEVDKHLHIVLQREIIPELIKLFPNIQFLVSTHSAFINIGLSDAMENQCSIIDLDNSGIECNVYKNNVFREAYEVMTKENERYAYFFNELSKSVKDATKSIVYLEGRTDEKYFKKAYEIFGYKNDNIEFQWIGHFDIKGNEEFTGSKSLDQGLNFIKGRKPQFPQFFLYDCDTQKDEMDEGNIIVITMPVFKEHVVMNKGIENALEIDDFDLKEFYDENETRGDYGKITRITELNKMKLCEYICSLDNDYQKRILKNLKPIIDNIIERITK